MRYLVATESDKYCGYLRMPLSFSSTVLRDNPLLKETSGRSSLVPVFSTEYLHMLIDTEALVIIEVGDRGMVKEAFAGALSDYRQVGLATNTLLCIRTKKLTAGTVNRLLSGNDSISSTLSNPELFEVL